MCVGCSQLHLQRAFALRLGLTPVGWLLTEGEGGRCAAWLLLPEAMGKLCSSCMSHMKTRPVTFTKLMELYCSLACELLVHSAGEEGSFARAVGQAKAACN